MRQLRVLINCHADVLLLFRVPERKYVLLHSAVVLVGVDALFVLGFVTGVSLTNYAVIKKRD